MIRFSLRRYLLLLPFVIPFLLSAQISIDDSKTPQKLVEQLVGNGVKVFNVKYTGSPKSKGDFKKGNVSFPIDSGIVLGSGALSLLQKTTINGISNSGDTLGQKGDVDLDTLLEGKYKTIDASVLEFDFIPSSSKLAFNFVFSSAEYPEYVCDVYADVFGFFISGKGLSGGFTGNAQNFALVPGTNLPVSVNTINNGNSSKANCKASHSDKFISKLNKFPIALTKKLAVNATLAACDTFHIKIAIADASDSILSSFVFLEQGSFSSPAVQLASVSGDNEITEGESGGFQLELEQPVTKDSVFTFTLKGTAVNGEDYEKVNLSVTVPKGEKSVVIPIKTYKDDDSSGTETVVLELNYSVCSGPQSVSKTLYIKEAIVLVPIVIPNVFTPNGDGRNDHFVISNLELYPSSKLVVYNRFGRRVFTSDSYTNNWNGNLNNRSFRLSSGVYFYELVLNAVPKKKYSGFVHLVR